MNTAKFVDEVVVKDPDFFGDVTIEIYKHENGGMFGIECSYLDAQNEKYPVIPDPYNDGDYVELLD